MLKTSTIHNTIGALVDVYGGLLAVQEQELAQLRLQAKQLVERVNAREAELAAQRGELKRLVERADELEKRLAGITGSAVETVLPAPNGGGQA